MKQMTRYVALISLILAACSGKDDGKKDAGNGSDMGGDGGSDTNTEAGSDTTTGTEEGTDTTDTATDGDTDGGDTDGDGGTGDDGGPTDECAALPFTVNVSPINLLIVLDRSRSMIINQLDGQTFRDIAKASINKIVSAYDDSDLINFGLTAFPSAPLCKCDDEDPAHWDDLYCTTEDYDCTPGGTAASGFTPPLVPIGPDNSADIAAQLDAIGTCGGTPICKTLEWAATYAASLSPELKAQPTHMLLVTDGAPNCNSAADTATCQCLQETAPGAPCGAPTVCLDDACANAAAKTLYETNGHSVFVLGVGENLDTNWGPVMNAIASNGGTGSYYSASNAAAFEAAIDNITSSAVECSYEIPWDTIPNSTASGNVDKECNKVRVYGIADKNNPDAREPIVYSHDCSVSSGWRWKEVDEELDPDSPSPVKTDQCKTVELCDDACDSLKKGKVDQVSFAFGCGLVVVVK